MAIQPAAERILRAKYLDWCSARVAERFLELTPDQIYDLAHRRERRDSAYAEGAAAVTAPTAGAAPAVHSVTGVAPSLSSRRSDTADPGAVDDAFDPGLNYRTLVARVAEVLAARLELPSFEEWASEYGEKPERFDEELFGLWQRGA